ncbi:Thioredoxin-like superfamily [Sesbania bispinosa]|nr:Thioredoxin-like superfamily [Sesbania bispinosa]
MSDRCMSIVVKNHLFILGVGPKVVELDEHVDGHGIQDVLCQFSGANQPIPDVFIEGKFLGGVESLLTYHTDKNWFLTSRKLELSGSKLDLSSLFWLPSPLIMKLSFEYK